jgi:hypothetical protein
MRNIPVTYPTSLAETFIIKYQTRLPVNITTLTLSNTLFYTYKHKDYILNLNTLESIQISFYLDIQYYENEIYCKYSLDCIKKEIHKIKSIKVITHLQDCNKEIIKLLVTYKDNSTKIYV